MAFKLMLAMVMASVFVPSHGTFTYAKLSAFSDSACKTSAGTYPAGPVDKCLPEWKDSKRVYIKLACNTSHIAETTYSDKTCKTVDTARAETSFSLTCSDTKLSTPPTYATWDCKATETDANVAVVMKFSDSKCTDAKFENFEFFHLKTCYSALGGSTWKKYECNGTTLQEMIYTDKECKTAHTTAPIDEKFTKDCTDGSGGSSSSSSSSGSGATTTAASGGATTTAAPGATTTAANGTNTTNGSNGSRRMFEAVSDEEKAPRRMFSDEEEAPRRRLGSEYYKLYSGCGVTGTLPAGIEAPPGAGGKSGSLSGAHALASVHFGAVAAVGAVFASLF